MRRWKGVVLAGVSIGGFWVTSHALRPSVSYGMTPTSPQTLSAKSGMPTWPWMPGGLYWTHGLFEATPYPVKSVPDAMLPKGQSEVIRPGEEGTVFLRGRKKTSITRPVPATMAKGTAVVHNISLHGVTYKYDRVMTMMTTAYNASLAMNGPSGAVAAWNGQPLKPGDVAVDPSVIPLGSYLYIKGYGPARAVDTGSAIIGDHVDLFLNKSSWAVALYGIKFEKVYVLTSRPPHFHG